ncbi:MAG: hypothetical protein WC641_07615 [Patescibacteria group bacterium]
MNQLEKLRELLKQLRLATKNDSYVEVEVAGCKVQLRHEEIHNGVMRLVRDKAVAWAIISKEPDPTWPIPLLPTILIDSSLIPDLPCSFLLSRDGSSCCAFVQGRRTFDLKMNDGYIHHGSPAIGYVLRPTPRV